MLALVGNQITDRGGAALAAVSGEKKTCHFHTLN